ncbi:hypothetical protein GCM10010399_40670 [Dactylosporangium fulvum]|uniref:PQQ-like beta-propeller repeat protein n=1 Tax=Dactylosporangium fulvum TaxID=53359 RepID=A0ABY5W4Q2_9ACTN|nr:PQQ-like beta-propeller repeat protein [Dactylosporangium fulvum]UWP84306.1 PQQ-like beta-propeller repeat protein [Dactylosporangium fulvum]
MIIELDLATPWEPPAPPPRRVRRWSAAVLVAVVALGVLVAAAPRRPDGPAFTIEHNVLNVAGAGGRIFVGRFHSVGSAPRLHAMRLSDGAELWSTQITPQQRLALATAQVVVLSTDWTEDASWSTIAVLDAATGGRLWHRDTVQVLGRAGGTMVVEDMAGADPDAEPPPGPDDDPAVNRAPVRRQRHYLGLDERTGATVWTLEVPAGSAAEAGWDQHTTYKLLHLAQLDPDGLLRLRDPATGAITGSHRLAWSGTIASFTVSKGRPGQVIVFPAGQRGAAIFDLDTGERLWGWSGKMYGGLLQCGPDRYCGGADTGLDNVDVRTGRIVWHIDRYAGILHIGARTMVLGSYIQPDAESASYVVVDAATGRLQRKIEGWRLIGARGEHLIVSHPGDRGGALLGVLDPGSGVVALFGKAPQWYGMPECTADEEHLACVAVGALSVWRLPPTRRP